LALLAYAAPLATGAADDTVVLAADGALLA